MLVQHVEEVQNHDELREEAAPLSSWQRRVQHKLTRAGKRCFDQLVDQKYWTASNECHANLKHWRSPDDLKRARKRFAASFISVLIEKRPDLFADDESQRTGGQLIIGGHDGLPFYIRMALERADLPRLEYSRSCALLVSVRSDVIQVMVRDATSLSFTPLRSRLKLALMV